ncbi:MAG: hypothetical protein J2P41_16315 [Blastocatellia bacterium]|nr:hypothetical protein [Blastocatellia bacterium]
MAVAETGRIQGLSTATTDATVASTEEDDGTTADTIIAGMKIGIGTGTGTGIDGTIATVITGDTIGGMTGAGNE